VGLTDDGVGATVLVIVICFVVAMNLCTLACATICHISVGMILAATILIVIRLI
jgi:hypothetical protein